jgi:hypothetical protein
MLPRDKMVFLLVYPWSQNEIEGKVRYFTNGNGDKVGGTAFIGTKEAIYKYHSLYYPLVRLS